MIQYLELKPHLIKKVNIAKKIIYLRDMNAKLSFM